MLHEQGDGCAEHSPLEYRSNKDRFMLKFLFRTVCALLVLAGVLLAYGLLLPAGPTQEKLVQLKPGSSAHHIAAELAHAGHHPQ